MWEKPIALLFCLAARCPPAGPASCGRSNRAWRLSTKQPNPPAYLLFTDADIVYGPEALSRLVARAQPKGLVLASLMVKLRCESFAERLFIPAFIFFFQMLYPFAWANDPRRATAAAAGGCMLVRRDTLRDAGGLAAIRGALIDDCALAKLLKAHGPIWIGLTERVRSIRAYPAVADIRRMVSRTAYAQLRYSPLLLAGTIVGLALTYLAPVALALFADGIAQFLGIFVWASMALAFRPTLRFYGLSAFWGLALPAIAAIVYGLYAGFRLSAGARARRHVEGPRASQCFGIAMSDAGKSDAGNWRSGKGHRNENFPVASWLIQARHRPPILAFYNFVRTADDIADHATLKPEEKLALLDRLDAGLTGKSDEDAVAVRLRDALAERNLSPKHAQDLLAAFKLDVTKLRYRDWDDLIGYCSLSAMPVGRFVCDVHGESRSVWPANDALCAALQIINHLQDCKADYLNLNRVYVPLDALAACGATVEALGAPRASPALLDCLHALAARTERLLSESDVVSAPDQRLASRPRSFRHQHAGASSDAHADDARSAHRSRPSESSRRGRPDDGRHLCGRVEAARPAFVRDGGKTAGCLSECPTFASSRARLGQLVLQRHADSAPRAARSHVRDLLVLPRRRRYRRRSRAARTAARGLAALARGHRRALQRRAAASSQRAGASGEEFRP